MDASDAPDLREGLKDAVQGIIALIEQRTREQGRDPQTMSKILEATRGLEDKITAVSKAAPGVIPDRLIPAVRRYVQSLEQLEGGSPEQFVRPQDRKGKGPGPLNVLYDLLAALEEGEAVAAPDDVVQKSPDEIAWDLEHADETPADPPSAAPSGSDVPAAPGGETPPSDAPPDAPPKSS